MTTATHDAHRNAAPIATGLARVTDHFARAATVRALAAQGPSGPVALALMLLAKAATQKAAKNATAKLQCAVTECVEILNRRALNAPAPGWEHFFEPR